MQSLLDDYGLAEVSRAAEAVKQAVEQQQFQKATELWSLAETAVEQVGTKSLRCKDFRTSLFGVVVFAFCLRVAI